MICPNCHQLNDEGANFCRTCGSNFLSSARTVVEQPVTVLVAPETVRFAVGKKPGAALFFAVFGFGQFYNGDFKRGILIVILTIVTSAPALAGVPAILVVWIWGMVNAYNVAARKTPLWT